MKTISKSIIICCSLFGSLQLHAANEIIITGRVIDSTCTLTGTVGTDSGSNNISVLLDTVPASSFSGLNSVLATKAFTVQLTKSDGSACDSVTIAGLKGLNLVAGAGGYTNSSVLLNTAYTGTANRVNLQVLTDTDAPVTFNTVYPNQPRSAVNSTTGIITYKAQYILSDTTAIAQDVQATVNYTLEYN